MLTGNEAQTESCDFYRDATVTKWITDEKYLFFISIANTNYIDSIFLFQRAFHWFGLNLDTYWAFASS